MNLHLEHMKAKAMDRRVRKLRRIWWDLSEDLGVFLWCIVAAMVATGIILIYGLYPRGH